MAAAVAARTNHVVGGMSKAVARRAAKFGLSFYPPMSMPELEKQGNKLEGFFCLYPGTDGSAHIGGVVGVLLVTEQAVARVVQNGDIGFLVNSTVTEEAVISEAGH